MQFYSRTSQRPATHGTFPGTSFTPDGGMRLAMPVRVHEDSTGSGSGGASSQAPTNPLAGENIVLMQPSAADLEEEAPRSWLLLLIACDAAILVVCLAELSWRTVYVDSTLGSAVGGFAVLAIGGVSCWWRMPLLLGTFAIASIVQFCFNALMLQSFAQLCHVGMQPLLVRFALLLRRALVPQWFAHGRALE